MDIGASSYGWRLDTHAWIAALRDRWRVTTHAYPWIVLSPAILDRESRRAFRAVKGALGLERWPEVPIRWNRRLRRAGRAIIEMPAAGFQSATIELSPAYFAVYPGDLYGILVHEAVHVGLAIIGEPFGHGPEFREACLAASGLLHSRWLPGRVYVYRCPVCSAEVERRRPVSESRWCADCADAAATEGTDPFVSGRALVLVRTEFRGPEPVREDEPHVRTIVDGDKHVTEDGRTRGLCP